MRRRKRGSLLLLLACSAPAVASDRIGDIEFFGYKGFDVAAIRKGLPVHEGDQYSEQTKALVRQSVAVVTGREATDVAAICCDEQGNRLLFIGLSGDSYKSFSYNTEPKGTERLSSEIMRLYDRLDRALEVAVRKGGESAQEDDSKGYALINEPAARSLQLAVREWALQHEPELLRVLEFSSAVQHRRVASDALGYARQSRAQILALVSAGRDPDSDVRNNATRALGVLVRSDGRLAAEIPPDTFVEMLNSGTWTDRNKGTALVEQLTAQRSSALLARIRSLALDSLIEMATWRRSSHAYRARVVLGRIGGLPEERLHHLAWNGPVETIVESVDDVK